MTSLSDQYALFKQQQADSGADILPPSPEVRPVLPQVAAAQAPVQPANDYLAWRQQQHEIAVERANLAIENAVAPKDAQDALKLSEQMQLDGGVNVKADLLTNNKSVLVKALEARSRKAALRSSSKLATWVSQDPINAALAQKDLENLSWMGNILAGLGTGVDNLITAPPDRIAVKLSEERLALNQRNQANRDKGFLDIFAANKKAPEKDTADQGFVGAVVDAAKKVGGPILVPPVVSDFASRFTGSVVDFLSSRTSNLYSDAELKSFEEGFKKDLSQAFADEQANHDRISSTYGRSKLQVRGDNAIAEISKKDTLGEQMLGMANFVTGDFATFSSWLARTAVESLPAMGVSIAAGAVTHSVGVGAATLGATSFAVSETSAFENLVQGKGYDLRDPEQRMALVNDPEFRAKTRDRAFVYGAVVGLVDAASGGIAGKELAKSPMGDLVLQSIVQAVMGGTGEALGALASGQKLNMVDVLVEALAEFATAPIEVVGVGRRYAKGRKKAALDQDFIAKVNAGATASELRDASPERFRALVEHFTNGTDSEVMHVDARSFDELFQQDKTLGTSVDYVKNVLGMDATQYEAALESNGTFELPTAVYATDIVGTSIEPKIREHMKTSPDSMSAAEATQLREQLPELLAAARKTTDAVESGRAQLEKEAQEVFVAVKAQLEAAGHTSDVAADEAAQNAAFVHATSKRLGLTVQEFLTQYPMAQIKSAFASLPDDPRTTVTDEVRAAVNSPERGSSRSARDIADAINAEGLNAAEATPEQAVAAVDKYFASGSLSQKSEGFDPDLVVTRLKGLERMSAGPVPRVRDLAAQYMRDNGMEVRHQAEYVQVNIARATEIARLYDEMLDAPNDPEVKAAYEALAKETIAQYEALLALGFTFEWITGENPYASPREAIVDMQENKHLWVFPTDSGFGTINAADEANPLLAMTDIVVDGKKARVNDLFRIVHDVFGHGSEGASFGARGEENAWQAHVRMFSPLAARAMTTETRGQNSWVNFGPFGEANRADPANTTFADQKVGLLPKWVSELGQAADAKSEADKTVLNQVIREIFISGEGHVQFIGPPRPTSRPSAGGALPRNVDGTVTLTHWSDNAHPVLTPDKAGTGPLKGAERNRRGPKKVFFGIGVGTPTGYVKELLGDIRHEVNVQPRELYDLTRDPDNLTAAIPDDVPSFQRMGYLEESIKDKGFRGYYVRDGQQGMAAALFDNVKVDTINDDKQVKLYQSGATPDFFSSLTLAVDGAKQAKASGKEWMAIIAKLKGVKKAEIDWSGVNAWLAAQEGQIPREAVSEFLRKNEVNVETVTLTSSEDRGGSIDDYSVDVEPYGEVIDEDPSYLEDIGWENYGEELVSAKLDEMTAETPDNPTPFAEADISSTDMSDLRAEAADRAEQAYLEDPHYSYDVTVNYPDGSITTEMLFVYSYGDVMWEGTPYNSIDDAVDAIREERMDEAFERSGPVDGEAKWDEYVEAGGDNYQEVLLTVPNLEVTGLNRGLDAHVFVNPQHFDEGNIVVHARLNFRKSADGSKVMFVEEIQSDLGTQNRDDERSAEARAQAISEQNGGAPRAPRNSRMEAPLTPFENEAYYALMVRKLLKLAAENGADKLAWTPAYMQARRWSGAVRNVVQTITWQASDDVTAQAKELNPNSTVRRAVVLRGVNGIDTILVDEEGVMQGKADFSGGIPETDIVGKPLSELIGKNMADQVMNSDGGELTGENIVIGGNGYINVYDRTIKKFVEKFAKKYGSRVTVDETMPDFAKDTGSDTVNQAVKRVGYTVLVRRLRRGFRDAAFWDTLDKNVDGRIKKKLEELEAQQKANRDAVDGLKRGIVDVADAVLKDKKHAALTKEREALVAEERAGAATRDANSRSPQAGAIDRLSNEIATAAIRVYDLQTARNSITRGKISSLDAMHEPRQRVIDTLRDPAGVANATLIIMRRTNLITDEQLRPFVGLDKYPKSEAVWSVDITPEMSAAAKEAQPLFQRNPKGTRGNILLPRDVGQAPVIELFGNADLSTFLHESSHHYLAILQNVAANGNALGEDWLKINQWWFKNAKGVAKDSGSGVTVNNVKTHMKNGTTGDPELDAKINVGLQEQWARAFETYLMEGKAPSNALRSAFEAFRSWLLVIYTRAKGDLNVSVSDELRGVFDRLLATDEEIAAVKNDDATYALVADTAEALGVGEKEYAALVKLGVEAQDEAAQRMLLDTMAPLLRAQRDDIKREREEVKKEETDKVNSKPANRVREWLGNRRWLGDDGAPAELPPSLRLDRAQLIEDYGKDFVDALPRGRFPLWTSDGTGVSADEVAGWFGYGSGDEMLNDIKASPKAADEIKSRTEAIMRKRHGDVLSDGTAEAKAVEALHGDKRGQLIAAELRALSKNTRGDKPTTRSQAKEIARRTIASLTVRKAIQSGQYLAAERRAAERSQQRLAKGDTLGAFEAKREQLINNALYNESRAAAETTRKAENKAAQLKRKGTRKNLDGTYLNAIDEVLDQYDFRKSVTAKAAAARGGLQDFVAFMEAEGRGNELAIPRKVLDNANRTPYKSLKLSELEGVLATLKNIEHAARVKKKLRDARSERDLQATVDKVVGSIQKNVKENKRNRVKTNKEKRGDLGRSFINLVLSADTLLRKLDGFDRGEAYDAIKEPIDRAANWSSVERHKAGEAFEKLYSRYSKKQQRSMGLKKHFEELGGSFSKWDLISMALNMGNADNLSRLMDKDAKGFNASQIDFVKNQLSAAEWAFVQDAFDLIEGYWPLIESRERRLTGTVPKKVEATPIETPFGTLKGGYYPIKYDGEQSGVVSAEDVAEIQQRMMAGQFGKAQTRRGHLEERANGSGGRVLLLGIEVLHLHVGQVIQDLAFSEAVTNSWRVLQHKEVRAAFEAAGLLQDHQTLEMWLQDVAVGQIAAGGSFGKMALRAKNSFTLSKLAFNVNTVLLQITGAGQSAVVIGARNMAHGYSDYLSNPQRTTAEVVEVSPFMKERMTTFNRDVNDLLGDITKGPTAGRAHDAQQLIARWGFAAMQYSQFYGVDMPTWLGAYRQGMDKFNDESKARQHADRMVARAQASGVFADRSAFERGTTSRDVRMNGFIRLFTALGSYMFAKGNVAYEVLGVTKRDVTGLNVKSARAALSGALQMTVLFTVEAVAYNLIHGTLPDGEEDKQGWLAFLAKETALSMMSTLPVLRDFGSAISGFEAGAYGSVITTFSRATVSFVEGVGELIGLQEKGKTTFSDLKNLSSAIGAATGLPTGQLNKTADAWYKLENGKDVSPIDFLMGAKR